MSLWEFNCVVVGWNKAQGHKEETAAPSDDRFDELVMADAERELDRRAKGAG